MKHPLHLQPQNKSENLNNVIERLAVKTHSSVQFSRLDETEWQSFLSAHESSVTNVYSLSQLDEKDRLQPFNWFQSDSTMTIKIDLPASEITVDSTSISSSVLNGTWWSAVTNIEVVDNGNLTQISLTVEKQWPYLIRGGNPDGLSCYFLAEIALELHAHELCTMWLREGAVRGHSISTVSYAIVLFDNGDVEQAFHFLCRCVVVYGDDMCGVLLANLLVGSNFYRNPGIAEELLCRICGNGFRDAFVPLAKLYLNGADGVAVDFERAKKLLKAAVMEWGDEEAKKLLSERKGDLEKSEATSTGVRLMLGGTILFAAVALGMVARRLLKPLPK